MPGQKDYVHIGLWTYAVRVIQAPKRAVIIEIRAFAIIPVMRKYCVATPLYRVNRRPGIGHARTAVEADILARHMRAQGREALLLTGTDGYGAEVEKLSAERGIRPEARAAEVSGDFSRAWKLLNISHDIFVDTTDRENGRKAGAAFGKLIGTGGIYSGPRGGFYCSSCEISYGSGGLCPVHSLPLEKAAGTAFFFRLSKYEKALLRHYKDNPGFLSPAGPAREIRDLVEAGLKDMEVSRERTGWGIKLPDRDGVIGARFGAALCGVYACGRAWPPAVQFSDRENFPFFSVLWPAALMALGLALPERIHLCDGTPAPRRAPDDANPSDLIRDYGVDALRYFLVRGASGRGRGGFSREELRSVYNSDLSGEIGTLAARVVSLSGAYLDSRFPAKPEEGHCAAFSELRAAEKRIFAEIEELRPGRALERILAAVRALNRRIDSEKPREKAGSNPTELKNFLKDMVWSLRLVADWLYPFMPDTSAKMQMLMSIGRPAAEGIDPQKISPLFPRRDY